MRAAIYARVSTFDQEPENQLVELRRYAAARGWDAREFVDHGVSGAKERRPALDAMVADAKRRRFDVVVVWRLDRLGRNLKHLITLIDEMQALGIAFVSLGEGIDATTPAGKLQLHILAAIAEFERARIQERVRAGLARARSQGKRLGRPAEGVPLVKLTSVAGLKHADAALQLGVSASTIRRWRRVHKTILAAA
jgi:DNA invertase Pin-like site-specific DNA recombinase